MVLELIILTTHPEFLTPRMNPMIKQPDNITFMRQHPNSQRRPLLPTEEKGEPEQFNNSPINHVVTAINNLPHILQRDSAQT